MAAAAGNASAFAQQLRRDRPALPVSETGVQTSTLSGKMVAREGAAPPISGCRPDVILFHHRAFAFTIYAPGLDCAATGNS